MHVTERPWLGFHLLLAISLGTVMIRGHLSVRLYVIVMIALSLITPFGILTGTLVPCVSRGRAW